MCKFNVQGGNRTSSWAEGQGQPGKRASGMKARFAACTHVVEGSATCSDGRGWGTVGSSRDPLGPVPRDVFSVK